MRVSSDLEQFVGRHRSCAELTIDVGALTDAGCHVRVLCFCGAVFARWVNVVELTPGGPVARMVVHSRAHHGAGALITPGPPRGGSG